jgi:hypothetical protein
MGGIFRKPPPAAPGDGIEFGFAVVVRSPPFGRDPALLLEANQRSVDGALIEEDGVAAHLLDAARNAITVQ